MSDDRLCPFCELSLSMHQRAESFPGMPMILCEAAPKDVISLVQPMTTPRMFTPGTAFWLRSQSEAARAPSPFEEFAENLARDYSAWINRPLGVEPMPVPLRDLHSIQLSALENSATPAAVVAGAGWIDEPPATWTCERGCGYDGNAAERTACEVCRRGRGD